MKKTVKSLPTERIGDWTVTLNPEWNDLITSTPELLKLINNISTFQPLSDRSLVAYIDFRKCPLIVKNPIERDRNYWQRVISPLRKSESYRSFYGSLLLHNHNMPVPSPVLFCERRKFGFLVESRFVSERVMGSKTYKTAPEEMFSTLQILHKSDFIHRDPHINNFLTSNERTYLIDLSKAAYCPYSIMKALDLALLKKSYPPIFIDKKLYISPVWFFIANTLVLLSRLLRESKRKIKGLFNSVLNIFKDS